MDGNQPQLPMRDVYCMSEWYVCTVHMVEWSGNPFSTGGVFLFGINGGGREGRRRRA